TGETLVTCENEAGVRSRGDHPDCLKVAAESAGVQEDGGCGAAVPCWLAGGGSPHRLYQALLLLCEERPPTGRPRLPDTGRRVGWEADEMAGLWLSHLTPNSPE